MSETKVGDWEKLMASLHRMNSNGDAEVVLRALAQFCKIGAGSSFQLAGDNPTKAARLEGWREMYALLDGWTQDAKKWAEVNQVGFSTTHASAPAAKKKTARKRAPKKKPARKKRRPSEFNKFTKEWADALNEGLDNTLDNKTRKQNE